MNKITLPSFQYKISLTRSIRSTRFSIEEQTLFAKRLSFLMNANVPLLDSLHMLKDQAKGRSRIRMFERIIGDVSQGQSLARSFGRFPRVFGQFALHIVKIGEATGTLAKNLNYLSDELKKRSILKRKIISAFIYPAVITVATFGITAFLMLYLFPKIMPIFSSLHMELPLTTRIVMWISLYLKSWGLVTLLGIIALFIIASIVLRKYERVRAVFDQVLLKLPLLGKVATYYNVANTSRTLGIMLKSGVKLSEALPITAQTTKNLVYRKHLMALAVSVDRGEKMSIYMHRHKSAFPDMFGHLIAVGEKSGTLSETLVYLSEMYEAEVDEFTKNLSTFIEPFLMIFMGLVVGFIAVSIITPIYGITQNLHG
jgi:type II secretory pathway component PulF